MSKARYHHHRTLGDLTQWTCFILRRVPSWSIETLTIDRCEWTARFNALRIAANDTNGVASLTKTLSRTKAVSSNDHVSYEAKWRYIGRQWNHLDIHIDNHSIQIEYTCHYSDMHDWYMDRPVLDAMHSNDWSNRSTVTSWTRRKNVGRNQFCVVHFAIAAKSI
jgi:hypothetical protein